MAKRRGGGGSSLNLAKWKKKYCNFTILTGRVSDNVDVDTAAAADFRPQQSQDKKRPTFSSGGNNDVSILSDASTGISPNLHILSSKHYS